MKPRSTILIALFLLLVVGILAFSKHRKNPDPPASSSATNGGAHADPLDDSTKGSRSRRERITPKRNEKMAAQLEAARIGRDVMVASLLRGATAVFANTSQTLATDLGLSEEQAAEVNALFAGRKKVLANKLASLTEDEAEDPQETLRQITALMRNKGLRDGLDGILTGEQLAAFDAAEANRRREAIEAKTRKDMTAVNAALTLTDFQKESVLAALSAKAAEKIEEEADARAIMSLWYGEMAAVIDLSNFRGLAGALNDDLNDLPAFSAGSTEYFRWKEQQRAERIESELSPLLYILDGNQITLYREHLEKELPH